MIFSHLSVLQLKHKEYVQDLKNHVNEVSLKTFSAFQRMMLSWRIVHQEKSCELLPESLKTFIKLKMFSMSEAPSKSEKLTDNFKFYKCF